MATTTTLLSGLASGNQDALIQLYTKTAPRLYAWSSLRIPRVLWARLHPEDLVQEVFLRAASAAARFDRQLGDPRSWLFGIAARTLAEQLRRLSVRRREGGGGMADTQLRQLPEEATSIVQGAVRREELDRLVGLVDELAPEEKVLLVQRGLEGRSHKDVGEHLGISPEAAEIRWRRLLQRLRKQWGAAGLGDG